MNSILKTDESTSNANKYQSILKNPLDEIFNDADEGDFELYENSKARDIGNLGVGNLVPLDLNCYRRTTDGKPDVGAYEFQ